jgi:hypothetical protein
MGNRMSMSLLALSAACLLSLVGCPNGLGPEGAASIATLSSGRVYTAGYSAGSIRAYYWVDDELRTISDAGLGLASKAACVVPTNLGDYAVGAITELVDDEAIERAVVWFNGRGELLDEAPSFAFAAALHGGKLYVAGWRNPDYEGDRPCVWELSDTWSLVDGAYTVATRSIVRHDLDAKGGYGQARDIVSDGKDWYACGYFTEAEGPAECACYWKGGSLVELSGGSGSRAEAIAVSGSTVYAGGGSSAAARYWIGDNFYDLSDDFPSGSEDRIVTALSLVEGVLYLGGTFYHGGYVKGFEWHTGTLSANLPPVIGAGARGADFYLGCQEAWLKGVEYHPLAWIGTLGPHGIRMRLY